MAVLFRAFSVQSAGARGRAGAARAPSSIPSAAGGRPVRRGPRAARGVGWLAGRCRSGRRRRPDRAGLIHIPPAATRFGDSRMGSEGLPSGGCSLRPCYAYGVQLWRLINGLCFLCGARRSAGPWPAYPQTPASRRRWPPAAGSSSTGGRRAGCGQDHGRLRQDSGKSAGGTVGARANRDAGKPGPREGRATQPLGVAPQREAHPETKARDGRSSAASISS